MVEFDAKLFSVLAGKAVHDALQGRPIQDYQTIYTDSSSFVRIFNIGNESMNESEFNDLLVALKDYGLKGCQVTQLTAYALDDDDLTREKLFVMWPTDTFNVTKKGIDMVNHSSTVK